MICMRTFLFFFLSAHVYGQQCPGGLPDAEVRGFLSAHNRLRRTISSGKYVARGRRMRAAKSPIPDLKWNCILERSATLVASSCHFGHSELVRCSKIRIGENIFMAWGSLNGLGKFASQSWESELQVHGWPENPSSGSIYDIGHATQMIWANTARIGCGMAACENGRVMVVCHYHTAGNFMGQNAYEAVDDIRDDPDDREDFARSLI